MKFNKVMIVIVLMVVHIACYAKNPVGTVNILTGYGYLKSPKVSSVLKDKCGVEVSYDESYSSAESIKRIGKTQEFYDYDIVIFPSEIYDFLKKKIAFEKSDLNNVTKEYNSYFKEHYLSNNYPNNIVYFTLSLTGFVWNPAVINISPDDSTYTVFKKAQKNIVILVHSLAGIWNLLDIRQGFNSNIFADSFKNIIQNVDVYITNGYGELYSRDNFAFAFQRSGDVILAIKKSKNKLNFLIHPKYSYVSPDLMAELNDRIETRCVARVLASKEMLDIVQKKTYYLSPYGTYSSVNDREFQKVYQRFFNDVRGVRWLEFFSAEEMQVLRYMRTRINLLPQVRKNHSVGLKHKPSRI